MRGPTKLGIIATYAALRIRPTEGRYYVTAK